MTQFEEDAIRNAATQATGCKWLVFPAERPVEKWRVWSDEGQGAGRHRTSICIQDGPSSVHLCIGTSLGETREEANANAVMMAAAPMLLAELDAVRAQKARIEEAIFDIARAAEGGHSYEATLANVLTATKRAMDVASGIIVPAPQEIPNARG